MLRDGVDEAAAGMDVQDVAEILAASLVPVPAPSGRRSLPARGG